MFRAPTLLWLRRDLRLADHRPLAHAQRLGGPVVAAFVFDQNIIASLPPDDRRLNFIHQSLQEIDQRLRQHGSRLVVGMGDPKRLIPQLYQRLGAARIIAGQDYEPYAKTRDESVGREVPLDLVQDQVIRHRRDLLNNAGQPFKVFTPYKKAWLADVSPEDYADATQRATPWAPAESLLQLGPDFSDLRPLELYRFKPAPLTVEPGAQGAARALKAFLPRLSDYGRDRDFPGLSATSRLSVHLRFGTVSIRELVRQALAAPSPGSDVWLSELIWREFYQMILDQFPEVTHDAFLPKFRGLDWPRGPETERRYEAWASGRTGYPIVDAAMREFNATGWMHNRLRMIVASFLVKDLLVDWRRGEAYFARGLLDFDLAANNGGWQWCASTGTDAQPYFRIFNPTEQGRRFDPSGEYIRARVAERASDNDRDVHSPRDPIVDHAEQRASFLRFFGGIKA